MGAPVTHFVFYGKDTAALKEFYEKAFDWHVDFNNPMNYGVVNTHAGRGINGGITSSDRMDNGTIVYIETDDPQALMDKAVSCGAEVVRPVQGDERVAIGLFKDPAGNIVGIAKVNAAQSQ